MSGRTIIVGILAAICGIFATVGVSMLRNGPTEKTTPEKTVLVAMAEIGTGQKIEKNMLETIPWYSDVLPPQSIVDPDEVVGMYAVTTIRTGDLIVKEKISNDKSDLLPATGKFAFTIEAKTPSSNVGANLSVGNRVDILWTTNSSAQTNSDQPVTVRLLNNVKILGIGQVTGEKDKSQKSLTFELGPKMDENLMFAQAHGTLALSLRNPDDNGEVEPIEITNLSTLMKEYEIKKNTPKPPSALEVAVKSLIDRFTELETRLAQPKPVAAKVPDRNTVERIKEGMRAITIQTPEESTALAGLLEPGDRVDLLLTLNIKKSIIVFDSKEMEVPSETLIKNVEILAVDTQLQVIEGDVEKKMSNSVTLLLKHEMMHDVTRAMNMGTLTLVLRGKYEHDGTEPQTVTSVDEFVRKHMRVATPVEVSVQQQQETINKIWTIRGGAVQEIAVTLGQLGKN